MTSQIDTDVRAMENHLLCERHQHPSTSVITNKRNRPSPIMPNQHHKRQRRWWNVNQMDDVQDSKDSNHPSNCIEPAAILLGKSIEEIEISRCEQTRNTLGKNERDDCTMNDREITSESHNCNQENNTQPSNRHQVNLTSNHHCTKSHFERRFNQPQSQRCHPSTTTDRSSNDISMGLLFRKKSHTYSITTDLPQRVLTTLFVYAILNHLSSSQHHDIDQSRTIFDKAPQQVSRIFPSPITAVAALVQQAENIFECRTDNDCEDPNRICHESRCICKRTRPIDDRGTCLPLAVVGELCSLSDQCLGNSACIESTCACGSNTISLFNPSAKIYYCHPKRGLHGECSHDAQCPSNAFCSTARYGCLCQNGYGPVTVKSAEGVESVECLPKTCSLSRDCESEFHTCEENRCVCLATHFDPHTAECYKFGSTGGKVDGVDQLTRPGSTRNGTASRVTDRGGDNDGTSATGGGFFTKTVKDLIKNSSDISVWLIVVLLSVSTLLLLALMIMIVRKYYLGYCWTAHKKEYEPNNENGPGQKSQAFSKNSINNKSFRKKTNDDRETDDDGDDDRGDVDDHHNHDQNGNANANDDTAAADRSHLVTIPSNSTSTTKTRTTTTTTTSTTGTVKMFGKTNGTTDMRPVSDNNGRVASKLNGFGDNRYVKVDMSAAATNNGGDHRLFENGHDFAITNGYHNQQQQLLSRPLASSTSTPV